MVLRTARTAFILAGFALLISTAGDVHTLLVRADLTGQGSTVLKQEELTSLSTLELRQHLSAPELNKRSVSAAIALGSIFLFLGFGLHAFLVRRKKTGEQAVQVHAAPARRGCDTRKMDRWFLWMTVRM